MKIVELEDWLNVPTDRLSSGAKKRVELGVALLQDPDILLLDEPTAGVDVELRRGMWDYLRGLTSGGTTILLTTHYLEEAEQLARHVAIIHKGAIVACGTMEEVLAMHDTKEKRDGYHGGRLEEVFLKLTRDI